jgi:hypothetical protein
MATATAADAHAEEKDAGGIRDPLAPSRVAERSGVPGRPLDPPVELAFGERSLAERAGFEPAVRFPVHTLSKRAP